MELKVRREAHGGGFGIVEWTPNQQLQQIFQESEQEYLEDVNKMAGHVIEGFFLVLATCIGREGDMKGMGWIGEKIAELVNEAQLRFGDEMDPDPKTTLQ